MKRGATWGAAAIAAAALVVAAVVFALRQRRAPMPEWKGGHGDSAAARGLAALPQGRIDGALGERALLGNVSAGARDTHRTDHAEDGISEAVSIIVGRDAASAARYRPRADALRSLAASRELSRADALALLEYVASTNGALRPSREAALRNDVLNLLRWQKGTIPGETADVLSVMLRDANHPPVILDYCVQHLGAVLADLSEPQLREAARDALCRAAESRESYAGTALYALAEDREAPDEQIRFLRRRAAALARGENASPLARISAVMLAGERGWTEVLPALRAILEHPGADVPLAIAALGAIGSLGGPQDIPLVESAMQSGGVRLAPAAECALSRLSTRR